MTQGLPAAFVHPLADVEEEVELGPGVRIWRFCHVERGARIGAGTSLGHGCHVGPGVVIGAGCRIQDRVSVFARITLEDDVFVGPGAVLTNVAHPRAEVDRRSELQPTVVRRGATIGANATVLPGLELGSFCFVAAGAVVTRSVEPYRLLRGAPARPVGWVGRAGEPLVLDGRGRARCPRTGDTYRLEEGRLRPTRRPSAEHDEETESAGSTEQDADEEPGRHLPPGK